MPLWYVEPMSTRATHSRTGFVLAAVLLAAQLATAADDSGDQWGFCIATDLTDGWEGSVGLWTPVFRWNAWPDASSQWRAHLDALGIQRPEYVRGAPPKSNEGFCVGYYARHEADGAMQALGPDCFQTACREIAWTPIAAPSRPSAGPPTPVAQDCARPTGACAFYRIALKQCNAGRPEAETVAQWDLDKLAAGFFAECVKTCADAPGNRQHFTVDMDVDTDTPNRCAYEWTWCTPHEDWTVCRPGSPVTRPD